MREEIITFWSPDKWTTKRGNLSSYFGVSESDGFPGIYPPDCTIDCGFTCELHYQAGDYLFTSREIKVYKNNKREYCYVEIWTDECIVSTFLFKSIYFDIFACSKFLELSNYFAKLEQAEALPKLVKTLSAFVRHGHGPQNISPEGD